MKISFHKKEMAEVLSKIQGLTGRKTSLSITSDVLIKAVGSTVSIMATDMETVFFGTYEADVEQEGILCINSKKFYEIVREYPDPEVIVNEVENRWVEIGKGDCLYHIVSSNHENFPEAPLIEEVNFIEIHSKDLRKMIEMSSIVGYSGEEKRIYVLGSLIEKVQQEGVDKIRIVSTDSKRLHCYDADFKGTLDLPEEKVIIPKKGLSEIAKFIDGDQDMIKVGIKNNHFIFKDENESLMIKLLEGEYPDYHVVIQHADMMQVEMDKSMFSTLMKRISILTSDEYKSVIMNFKDNELIVTITNPQIGESKERIMIPFSGEEIKSAFNPKYFMDALSLFDDSTVVLHLRDSRSACIIKGFDNKKLLCVIMAMYI